MEAAPDMRLEFDQADRLRRALRVSNMSVSDMADYLGVTRNTVSNWINGHTPPSTQSLMLFAMRTGVPYEWLETGTSGDPRKGPGRGPIRGNETIQYHNSPVIPRPVVELHALQYAS
jgi:transcriptional regulator with XRE-family HTH domain